MKTLLFILNLIVCIAFISVFLPNGDSFATIVSWLALGFVMFFINAFLYGTYLGIKRLF